MNRRIFLFFVLFLGGFLIAPGWVHAQDVQVKHAEKSVTIGSMQFWMHHVKPGETLSAIAKVYHVTVDQIMMYNPELKAGDIQSQMVIGIPVVEETEVTSQETKVETQETEVKTQESEAKTQETEAKKQDVVKTVPAVVRDTIVAIGGKRYVMHYVKQGETVWGLTKTFHVTEEELVKRNPEIKDGLKAGMVIGIPVVEEEERSQKEEERSQKEEERSREAEVGSQDEEDRSRETEVKSRETEVKSQETEVQSQETEVQSQEVVAPVPTITVPPLSDDDEYGDGYVIHTVKKAEKTRNLANAWNVSLEEFRQLNPSVGSRVFVGQKVLIPYQNTNVVETPEKENLEVDEPVVEQHTEELVTENVSDSANDLGVEPVAEPEEPSGRLIYSDEKPLDCYSSDFHANKTYRVALMVPLYLNDIDKLDTSRERAEKTKKTRAMKFLQFYEGFMMAVDSLTNHYGLHLNLMVMDVNENISGAEAAVEKLRGEDVDLIVGPFFSKSFAVVQEYAASKGILVVNPLSERESVVADASNVLKLKPSLSSMVTELGDLLRTHYPKSKVTLMTPSKVKDSLTVQALEQMLIATVPQEVQLTNAEMLDLIAKESQRRKMGKRVLSNLEVEGQIFSTKALEAHPDDVTYFHNSFQHLTYSDSEISSFKKDLSSARENVLIAYGDDLVFATKVLNSINKSARQYPITLIGLPRWGDFENLLVQNLLNMNAIYFDDHFVNYNDSTVLQFVDDFRAKYESEPMDYAFEGFDVGWYFLKALMEFGAQPNDCLPYYHLPLLHSNYYFNKSRMRDGLENRYWNVYQYDSRAVELKPLPIYSEKED